ncbi:MAG: hypothetical protein JST16_15605 [Bdellovibrionales bacterium]|nr:hypothetical protein [Bdellovibrionales bacterium]
MQVAVATKRAWLAIILICVGAQRAQATPLVAKVMGSLYDSAGLPNSTAKDIQIKLYSAASGGSLLWTSSVYNTSMFAPGRFSIAIDASSGSPTLVQALSDILPTGNAWFQIIVDSAAANGVMTTPVNVMPRIRAAGAAFALAAKTADGIRGNLLSTTAPTNGQTLAWNNGTQFWTPALPAGQDATFPIAAARRTTASMNLYVRTDGNDSTCTGLANASSASAPNCAFLTTQKAIDIVPEFILHPVTVNVVAGTYRQTTSGAALLNIAKFVSASAGLVVQSSGGSVTFSGATSGAPTTPVGKYGVVVQMPSRGVTIKGFTANYFTADGFHIQPAASAKLDGVTATNNTSSGLLSWRSYVELTGYNVFNSNGLDGIFTSGGYTVLTGATVQTNSNSSYGVIAADTGNIYSTGTSLITSSSNTKDGISAFNKGTITGTANLISNSNSQIGISAGSRGLVETTGNTTATGNGNYATHSWGPSSIQYDGNFTASGSGWTDIVASELGVVAFNKAVTVTTGTVPAWSVNADAVWKGSIFFNNNGSDAVSFTGTGSTAQAWSPVFGGMIKTTGSGSVTLATYQFQGIYNTGGIFIDSGTGTRSITGTGSGNKAWIEEQSLYRKGGFPAASGCLTASRCN